MAKDKKEIKEEVKDITPEVKEERPNKKKELSEEEKRLKRIEHIRKTRVQSGHTKRLVLRERPGYHRHIFNDVGTRIEDKLAEGWAFVTNTDEDISTVDIQTAKRLDSVVSFSVGFDPHTQSVIQAYGMELPIELYVEDKHREAEKSRQAISEIKLSKDIKRLDEY